jgi:hypothetical protein
MNNLLDKKKEQLSPYFFCILCMNLGVLIMNVAVIKSANIGFGPGRFESPNQFFRLIGSGICAYSGGRGAK